jgi:phosphohistidine phosphatase
MKILILVRHAKSSWNEPDMSDEERPLNERGKKDAPEMAKRLKEHSVKVDQFVSSTARRAKRTARYFAEEFGKEKEDIVLKEKLYLAEPAGFADVIRELDDQYDTVALFAHNPGITTFASSLTNVRIDDMPTCAVFA